MVHSLKGGVMFFSRPWNLLTLIAGALVLVGYVSTNVGVDSAHAMTNSCPTITGFSVSPLKASVGEPVDVSVAAADEDGDDIDYAWTGTGGSFADPTASETTYQCQQTGAHSITVTVSDGWACTATWTARVTCIE
jgi:hypothetical protein